MAPVLFCVFHLDVVGSISQMCQSRRATLRLYMQILAVFHRHVFQQRRSICKNKSRIAEWERGTVSVWSLPSSVPSSFPAFCFTKESLFYWNTFGCCLLSSAMPQTGSSRVGEPEKWFCLFSYGMKLKLRVCSYQSTSAGNRKFTVVPSSCQRSSAVLKCSHSSMFALRVCGFRCLRKCSTLRSLRDYVCFIHQRENSARTVGQRRVLCSLHFSFELSRVGVTNYGSPSLPMKLWKWRFFSLSSAWFHPEPSLGAPLYILSL